MLLSSLTTNDNVLSIFSSPLHAVEWRKILLSVLIIWIWIKLILTLARELLSPYTTVEHFLPHLSHSHLQTIRVYLECRVARLRPNVQTKIFEGEREKFHEFLRKKTFKTKLVKTSKKNTFCIIIKNFSLWLILDCSTHLWSHGICVYLTHVWTAVIQEYMRDV